MENKLDKNQYSFTILRPSGNDTMLIKGLVKDPIEKKLINDQMMSLYPNVEQVGFYEFNPKTNTATLEMAGGEFCGNALRSLAFLVLKGKKGEIFAKVSGVKDKLKAGITKTNEAYALMPIYSSLDSVQKIDNNLFKVSLSGITYLITPIPKNKSTAKLKKIGFSLLKKTGLAYSEPACGVMFWSKRKKQYKLDPVVWVRDIKTLFYETACASGTAALGLWLAKTNPSSKIQTSIIQPSTQPIRVTVTKNAKGFEQTIINGPIEILLKGGE